MKKTLLAILILVMGLVAVTGCGKKTIVGSWSHSSYVYKFENNKTGSYTAGGVEMKFTYEDDGKKLSILYEGNTKASDYEYKIDGNKLIIKDSFGTDVEYTRK